MVGSQKDPEQNGLIAANQVLKSQVKIQKGQAESFSEDGQRSGELDWVDTDQVKSGWSKSGQNRGHTRRIDKEVARSHDLAITVGKRNHV